MYSIDSAALIDAWVRKYPPDFLPSLWQRLEQLVLQGQLVAPEEVLLELERGGDDLYDWALERPAMFRDPNDEIQARVGHIVNTFPSFIPDRAQDGIWADPYVIALAQTVEGTVVTAETHSSPNARHLKIPDVCDHLNIRCISPLEFFRENGWHF